MRFNRKAAQRAIALAVERNDATVIPFGLAFQYPNRYDQLVAGVRQSFSSYMWLKHRSHWDGHDDAGSVRFNRGSDCADQLLGNYVDPTELRPAIKPRSLKKRELRKRDRDMRRMKQYD